jgi:Bacterial membrane protein YfhO
MRSRGPRVVAGVRVSDGMDALIALLDPAFDPARMILLPRGQPVDPPAGFRGAATILHETADAVEIEAALSADGYLVLADTYDPGWKARVDGVSVAIQRANLAFRAVALPAGRHRVEMLYRPAAVLAAVALSALTILSSLLFLALPLRRGVARQADATSPAPARSNRSGTGEEPR